MSYNHPRWPSPYARIVAKNLRLDFQYEETLSGLYEWSKIKRLTHAHALELLSRSAGKASVEEFLAMSREEAWAALGCYKTSSWFQGQIVYDPLYGPNPKYKPRW
jgi:hypothetical protein